MDPPIHLLHPIVHQGKKGELDKGYRVDKDLAAAEAKRLIAFERQQEDDAYLLSKEYDDDYDDQVFNSAALSHS